MFTVCGHGEGVTGDDVGAWQPMMSQNGGIVAINMATQERRFGLDALDALGDIASPPWYVDREKILGDLRRGNPDTMA